MAININFTPSAQLIGAAGQDTGRNAFLTQERRRQEDFAQRMAELQATQQFAAGQQNQRIGAQLYDSGQSRQFRIGQMFLQDAQLRERMGMGHDFQRDMAEMQHEQRQELGQQNLERQKVMQEAYQEQATQGLMMRFGLSEQEAVRQQQRKMLNSDGKALFDDFSQQRAAIMSDPTLTLQQKQIGAQKLEEKFGATPWANYELEQESEPGATYTKDGFIVKNDEKGMPHYLGPAFGEGTPFKSMQDWVNHYKTKVPGPDGTTMTEWIPQRDRSGALRMEKIYEAPKPQDPLEIKKLELQAVQVKETKRVNDARIKLDEQTARIKLAEARTKALKELMDIPGPAKNGVADPLYSREEAEAKVNEMFGLAEQGAQEGQSVGEATASFAGMPLEPKGPPMAPGQWMQHRVQTARDADEDFMMKGGTIKIDPELTSLVGTDLSKIGPTQTKEAQVKVAAFLREYMRKKVLKQTTEQDDAMALRIRSIAEEMLAKPTKAIAE